MNKAAKLTRRSLLCVGGIAAVTAALAACAPKIVKETVVVEKAVEKVVKETQVVEKEKEVTKVVEKVVTSQPAASGPLYLRFSVWYGQGDIEVWDQVNVAFAKAQDKIKIAFEPLAWSQYWQKLQVGLASGDPPDAFGMGIGTVYEYIGRKQLLAVDPFLDRDSIKREQWFQGLLQESVWPKPSGSMYALPYRFTGSAFFVNKTLFKNANLEVPKAGWTWPTDYLKLAKALTDSQKGQWGCLVPGTQLVEPFIATNDTSVLTTDLKHSNHLDAKVVEVYQFMADLICKDQVAPKPADVQGLGDMFLSGKVAMNPGAQWDITAYRKIKDFEWDVVPNPVKEGVNKRGTYGGPDMVAIPQIGKHPEEAWKYILFVTGSAEGQKLMSATGIPTLIEQARSDDFINGQAKLGPASYRLIVEESANASGFSFSPGWNEWNSKAGQVFPELYSCKMSTQEALTRIHDDTEKVLEQAWQALEKGS